MSRETEDVRLSLIRGQLRQNLPHMSPECELAQHVAKYGAEEGLRRAAVEVLRRIDGIDQTIEKIQRGRL